MQTLTQIPSAIEAGTSVEYTWSHGDYPSNGAAPWTLKLILQGASKLVKSATATPGASSFDVALTTAETAALAPGVYDWLHKVTKGTTVKIASKGRLEILPDAEAAAAGALQTWEEKTLAIVEKVIAFKSGSTESGRLSADIQEYEIAGRRVVKHELKELWAIRDDLKRRIAAILAGRRVPESIRMAYNGGLKP